MKSIYYLFIFCAIIPHSLAYDKAYCLNEGLYNSDCEWYVNCLEERFHCGENGYPLGYGYKYCTRFVDNLPKFSP